MSYNDQPVGGPSSQNETGVIPNQTKLDVNSIGSNGMGKKKSALPIAVAVIVIAIIVFIFASYEGYVPFLKISATSNPYYSVSNFNQLASVSSKLSNNSGPFNMSYSVLLSLSATAGTSIFSFNLPVNGYISHYSPYTKETAKINVLSLLKSIAALNSQANISTFPSALYYINLTSIDIGLIHLFVYPL